MADREFIAAALERVKKATKGPWHPFYEGSTIAVRDRHGNEIIQWMGFDEPTARGAKSLARRHANATFIAHARDDVPEFARITTEQMKRAERLAVVARAAKLVVIGDGASQGALDRAVEEVEQALNALQPGDLT